MDRYRDMFSALSRKGEGAFIPFTVIGDPDLAKSLKIIQTLVDAGADALELGLPFSDPVADGPLIQRAALRARESGTTIAGCFGGIRDIRKKNPEIPIGLLVYANLVESNGAPAFFEKAALAGVDSVLIADIPVREINPYKKAASRFGIKLVLILPMDSGPEKVLAIAGATEGYLYLLSRRGVTGVDKKPDLPTPDLLAFLEELKAPPPVLGFGISDPAMVKAAIKSGCKGAISGSAVVKKIEEDLPGLKNFIRGMKAATRPL